MDILAIRGPWKDDHTGYYTLDKLSAPFGTVYSYEVSQRFVLSNAMREGKEYAKENGLFFAGHRLWDKAEEIAREIWENMTEENDNDTDT